MYNLGEQFKRNQEIVKAKEKCIYKGENIFLLSLLS